MKRRIEVTNKEGNAVHVNADHIVWVRPIAGKADGAASILVVTGAELQTQESAAEILAKLDPPVEIDRKGAY